MSGEFTAREARDLRRLHRADMRKAARQGDKSRDKRDGAIFFGVFGLLTLLALALPGILANPTVSWMLCGLYFAGSIAGIRLGYRAFRDEIQDLRDMFAR